MAAAALALLKSYHHDESHEWLRQRLRDTADDLYEPGFDVNSGYGRINVIRACYGSDRFESEADMNGFVDIGPHDGQVFDTLHDVPSGSYIDTEDRYKVAATEKGCLLVYLDIFTWGENLDFELYSDPSMAPEFLLDSQTGANHAASSFESGGIECEAGETYYIRVFTGGSGDSTAYGLTVTHVENMIDTAGSGSYNPGVVRNGRSNLPAGYMDLDTSFKARITRMIVSHDGSMPADRISGLHAYLDSNGNEALDGSDELVGDATVSGTNRFIFQDMDALITYDASPMRMFLTVDLSGISEDGDFGLSLASYKDITTEQGLGIPYNRFPITVGPFSVGVDYDPPTWDSTVGIQSAEPRYEAALLKWNSASDVLSPPVDFNVYWTQDLPFDFGTANKIPAVSFWGGGTYDHAWLLTGLINDETYYVAVRAQDQAGLEETNTAYLEVVPTAVSDPTSPEVIGSVDTPGSAWEVVVDPGNERVFVADYSGGVLTIDVSNPLSPQIVDQVPAAAVAGVDFNGTYVFAAGQTGLYIIDPDAPGGAEVIGQATISSALDACVVGNWVYVTDFGSSLVPVDVTDPYNPVRYTAVSSGYYGYGMDAQNGYLYVATYTKPRAFSLTDPSAPVETAVFGGNGAYEVDALGDRLYVTYWDGDRFSVYSLSNPASPSFLAGFTSNSGSGGSDIVWVNNHIYFGTNDHFVEVINVDNTSNMYEVGQVSTDGPDGMDTDGLFIYSAENEDGLKIIL